MTQTLNRWLPSVTLACWGLILLYFHASGRLASFLHPAFRPGVFVAGVVLMLFALGSAYGGSAACCRDEGCGHSVARFTFGKLLAFAVLLLPLGMVVGLSSSGKGDSFGAGAIMNRGIVTDASGLTAKPPGTQSASQYTEDPLPTNAAAPTSQGTQAGSASAAPADSNPYTPKTADGNISASVIDLLYAAQDSTLRVDFEGKVVEIVGQLMAEKAANPTGNRMKLVRMFMTCCAADAKPVAALLELPPDLLKNNLPELSWVKVVGIPTFPMEGGRMIAVLKVRTIVNTPPPEESMLY